MNKRSLKGETTTAPLKGAGVSRAGHPCGRQPLGITVVPSVENIDIERWLDSYVRAIASAQKSTSLAA